MRRALGLLLPLLILAAGCSGTSPTTDDKGVLRVLGGSELADMAPILDEAAKATGVRVQLEQTGTLEGAGQVASGATTGKYDAIWFSSNRYLALQPGAQARIGAQVDIMSSPVVLGLRRSVAERLGWVGKPVTWADIAAAAGKRQFSYGMTDPSASNSGFSTVVAVSTALVGSGAALTVEQATSTAPALKDFFAAQALSAGSSGWLQDAFVRRATGADPGPQVDGLVNYESVLLQLNAAGTLPEPLEIIRPTDGVITADYPFTVLADASPQVRDAARTLTDYLRTPEVQRRIQEVTARRAAVPGVAKDPRFGDGVLVELPFPASADTVDALLTSWFDKVRKPSRTIYVLDVSGSMGLDNRIQGLRAALVGLTGADLSPTGRYRRFRGREEVTLLAFETSPHPPQTFTVDENNPAPTLAQIADAANQLTPGGSTAIYDSLDAAYALAAQQIATDPERFTSIVLMTDGENTTGTTIDDFRRAAAARPAQLRGVPVFAVLFGESDNAEMAEVAQLTGGRTFDAHTVSLDRVFSEIRGYV